MSCSLASHVLLQFIFLLSFYVAAHGGGKDYIVLVYNTSDRNFFAVVKDENGAVKTSPDELRNRQVMEVKVKGATGATCYKCELTYVDHKGVNRTVTIEVFNGEEVQKQLGHKSDTDNYVMWLLTNNKLYDITTEDIGNAPYKTWEELVSESNSNNHNDNGHN